MIIVVQLAFDIILGVFNPLCLLLFVCIYIYLSSSLDIAPLTILNSGTLQPRKWQLTGNDSVPQRTQWQPRACANGLLGPQLQPAGVLRPSQPR